MKCTVCDGRGYFPVSNIAAKVCPQCNGTGEMQMTNEEWFCQLPTEEKVNALLNLHEKVRQRMRTDIGGENSFYKGDYYRKWLKEKHNG